MTFAWCAFKGRISLGGEGGTICIAIFHWINRWTGWRRPQMGRRHAQAMQMQNEKAMRWAYSVEPLPAALATTRAARPDPKLRPRPRPGSVCTKWIDKQRLQLSSFSFFLFFFFFFSFFFFFFLFSSFLFFFFLTFFLFFSFFFLSFPIFSISWDCKRARRGTSTYIDFFLLHILSVSLFTFFFVITIVGFVFNRMSSSTERWNLQYLVNHREVRGFPSTNFVFSFK